MVFAGLATTRCPLTLDHEMLRQFLDEVDFAPPDQDGTAIGMGLATAVNRLPAIVGEEQGRRAGDRRAEQPRSDRTPCRGRSGACARREGLHDRRGHRGEALVPVDLGPRGRQRVLQPVDLDEPLLQEIADDDRRPLLPRHRRRGAARGVPHDRRAREDRDREPVRVLYTELFAWALVPRWACCSASDSSARRACAGSPDALRPARAAAVAPRAAARSRWPRWASARARRRALERFAGGAAYAERFAATVSVQSPRVQAACSCCAALGAAIVAAARPQWGTRLEPIARRGVDVVIVLDTSLSMAAEDVTPSRLASAPRDRLAAAQRAGRPRRARDLRRAGARWSVR